MTTVPGRLEHEPARRLGPLDRVALAVDRLSTLLTFLSVVVLIVLALHVIIDVAYRLLTGTRLDGTLEFSTYWWLPLVILLALAGAQLHNEHIRVTVAVETTGPRARQIADALCWLISIIVLAYIINAAIIGAETATSFRESEGAAVTLATWPMRWAAVAGFVILTLQTVISLLRVLGWVGPSPLTHEPDLLTDDDDDLPALIGGEP